MFFYFLVAYSINLKYLTIRRLCDWVGVLLEMFQKRLMRRVEFGCRVDQMGVCEYMIRMH